MGRAPAREHACRDLPRSVDARARARSVRPPAPRALPDMVAALPPHVSLGAREANKRRPNVEAPDRAHLSLPNPAASNALGLVCAAASGVVPEGLLRRDVRD